MAQLWPELDQGIGGFPRLAFDIAFSAGAFCDSEAMPLRSA
jgi:hypothetical protein